MFTLGKFGAAALIVGMLAGTAIAEERSVESLVGKEVLAWIGDSRAPKRVSTDLFNGSVSAVKHPEKPRWGFEVNGETYWLNASSINFKDRPLSNQLACNTANADFVVSTLNSVSGSGEKTDCTPRN